jgi:putative nucleotidyltransferase with HDIG domain
MLKVKKRKKISEATLFKMPLSVIGIMAATIFICTLFFQKNQYRDYQYEINSITHEAVIAPFTFSILKSDEVIEKERNEMLAKIPYVFEHIKSIRENQFSQLDDFNRDFTRLNKYRNNYEKTRLSYIKAKDKSPESSTTTQFKSDSTAYFDFSRNMMNKYNISYGTDLSALLEIDRSSLPKGFFDTIKNSLDRCYDNYILGMEPKKIRSEKIIILEKGEELLEYPENIATLVDCREKAAKKFADLYDMEILDFANELLAHFLEPNLIYNKEITERRQKEAIKKVPVSKGIVLENEKIVDANTKVTPEVYRKLVSLSRERAKRAEQKGGIRQYIPLIGDPLIFLGHFALITIIISFFVTFLLSYKPHITQSFKLTLLIGLLIIFQVALAFLFKYQFNISEFAIPITIFAMMMTILFDTKIGFVSTSGIAILIGTQIGGDVYFIISSIFVGSFAIYSVRRLRNRSQLFMSIIYIMTGYLISITISELLQFSDWSDILRHYLYAGINAVLAPFITYGLIGVIERPFDITTDLTLLELADFNHPLLKKLAKNAQGTFTHCIQVGNLAEAAADAVGANALLARVGSYYHDIGKIVKPEYFVENQSYISNKHDNLAPNMSALVIINHVKEGQRLAKEYKLPKVVADFVHTHHGTTKVEYFLNRAQNQAEDPEDINDADFQYPGPKPKTKETGIVMLVESIEAACRSIEKPTISNIIKVIDLIIAKRLEEGQLDECPLTFADLKKIKGDIKKNYGILPILKSIYHLRPEYPEKEKKN